MAFSNTQLDLRFIDDFVRMHGEWVSWYLGARCPCGANPALADYSCPNCQGLGHFYPSGPQNLLCIVTDVSQNRDLMGIPGFALPGDLSLTMRPYRESIPLLSDFDKVVLSNWKEGIPTDGETVTAGTSGVDRLVQAPLQVLSCYGTDSANLVDPLTLLTFVQGTDFTVSGNQITWISTNRPAPGTFFSIKYTSQPEWIVLMPPRPRYERHTSLGQSALLRRRTTIMGL